MSSKQLAVSSKKKINQIIENDVLSSKFGRITSQFEAKFAEMLGRKHAIAVNSGTSALHSSLFGAGVSKGDEVIIPGFSIFCVAAPIVNMCAKPVFVDVDPYLWNIDPKKIEGCITKKTKAIIVVNSFGLPAEMDEIKKIMKSRKIKIIENASQSMFSYYKNRLAGTIGDLGVFSFEQTKHISTGEGGMVVTNSSDINKKIRTFINIGYNGKECETAGLNYRFTEISAFIGLEKLISAENIMSKYKYWGAVMHNLFIDYDWIVPQYTPYYCEHSYFRFAFKLDEKKAVCNTNKFINIANKKGCNLKLWFKPAFYEKAFKRYYKNNCPVSEDLTDKVIVYKFDVNNPLKIEKDINLLKRTLKKIEIGSRLG